MKRLLAISPYPTHPPHGGSPARISSLLRQLQGRGYEITFVLVSNEAADHDRMRACWDRYFSVPNSRNLRGVFVQTMNTASWALSKRIALRFGIDDLYPKTLDEWLREHSHQERYDAVIVNYVFLSRALLHFGSSTFKIIDTHDLFADRHIRQKDQGAKPTWFFTSSRAEARGLRRADAIVAIQEREAAVFRQLLPGATVITVGHGVDAVESLGPEAPDERLLFVGSRHEGNYLAIQRFLSEAFPGLRDQFPNLTLDVVGSIGDRLRQVPEGCKILGEVNDLTTHYARAWVVINPMVWGTGLKIKTVEALGFGKPVVTTPVGAEGLEAGTGEAFLLVQSPEESVEKISRLLRDKRLRQKFSVSARTFIQKYNRSLIDPLVDILESAERRSKEGEDA